MDLSNSLFSIDYVNLNESEEFSLELEKIIHLWSLGLDDLSNLIKNGNDLTKTKSIKKFNLNFKISLIENDTLLNKDDYKQLLGSVINKIQEANYYYSNETNFIERIHGLKNFILIQTENHLDVLESERIVRLLNGSVSCSIAKTKCIYPILIQIKDNLLFELSTGIFMNFGIRIQYDSAIFDLNQFNSSTIADFLKIFENKLKRSLQLEDNLRCFLANRRCLKNYFVKTGLIRTKDLFNNLSRNLIKEFNELKLIHHLEDLRFQIKHTEIHPKIQGTQWTLNSDETVLKDFVKMKEGCLTVEINHLVESPIHRSIFYGQNLILDLSTDYLELRRCQLQNLNEFKEFCNQNYENKQNYLDYFLVKSDLNEPFINKNQIQFKSTPFDSIIFRFASFVFSIYLRKLEANLDDELIEKKTYFEINDYWNAIVDQLRRYWELCELIPCVEDKTPDLNSCLLIQKIQMLNCCIKEKQKREGLTLNRIKNDKEDEEDEFFDCETDNNEEQQAEGRLEKLEGITLLNNKNRSLYKPITQELTPYTEDNQDEYLKAYSGLSLNDDLDDLSLEDQNLGQLLIGKNILLISDMEAFKAANPECCFEDFIHWYSPKDFIAAEYDEKTGQLLTRECLSERFQSVNCLWRKIWQISKPVPVSKQKRLFNYSMEAERVLEYLSSIKFEDLMNHLFSTIVQIGCLKYKQLIDNCLFKNEELNGYFNEQIKLISERCKILDFEGTSLALINLENKIFDYLGLIYLFKNTSFNHQASFRIDEWLREEQLNSGQSNSLKLNNEKFNESNEKQLDNKQLNRIVNDLAKNKYFKISKDDNLGLIVFEGLSRMFSIENLRQLKSQQEFNQTNKKVNLVRSKEKEFTFIADCSRPAKYSRKLPQKLNFKVSSSDESRKFKVQMNGEFSEDIIYF